VSAEVADFVTHRHKVLGDSVFEIDGAVIGSDGNAEGRMAHGRDGIQMPECPLGNRKFQSFADPSTTFLGSLAELAQSLTISAHQRRG
jgi:hypothetical protein